MSVLELEGVSKNFGGVKALQDCSFYVKEGLITSLIGPNGAGKTTAFNVINGFIEADGGKITLHGEDITGQKPHVIAGKGISRTFQLPRVFDNLSIEENMLLANASEGEKISRAFFSNRNSTKEEKKKIRKIMKEVGFEKDISTLASDLSYGQKRLLEICRALMREHALLLLDEPTAGVNPKLRQHLKDILKKLRKQGKTILLIEHDMEFVMDLSDEVIVLEAGTKLMADKPEKVRKDPRVLEAYLGE